MRRAVACLWWLGPQTQGPRSLFDRAPPRRCVTHRRAVTVGASTVRGPSRASCLAQ
jgi:hypothetical protein